MAKTKTDISPTDIQVLEAMEAGRSFEDIAKESNVEERAVRARVLEIMKTLPPEELLKRYPAVYMRSQQIEGLDLGKDVLRLSRETGVSKTVLDAIRRRIDARQGLKIEQPKALTDRQLINALEEKIALVLQYLDPFSMAGSSAKDLEGVLDGLISNAQLLKGKPTSITSVEDRRKLNELLPLLVQEAKRRGVIVDGTAERIDSNPQNPTNGTS
jgi:hypothetical protein